MVQMPYYCLAYMDMFDFGQLEHQRRGDMRLLERALTTKKLPRLAVMIRKTFCPYAPLYSVFFHSSADEAL